MIYLDHAATSLPKPPPVIRAVAAAMESLGNSGRGAHPGSLAAARTVYGARQRIAKLLGCPSPEQVAFTSGATEALNAALFGLLGPGDHVIATDWEHNSVLRPLYRLEREQGIEVSFLPADGTGRLDYDALPRLLRPNTRAVVCTHASNLTGDVADTGRLSAFAKERGLYLIVDAAQTAGVLPIDMEGMGIDLLCFTGHKALLGPQGTGGLCVAPRLKLRPWKVGGTGVQSDAPAHPEQMPVRLEAGTLNSHGLAGLSAALDYLAQVGTQTLWRRETALAQRFRREVSAIPGVTVYGGLSTPGTAVVALNIQDLGAGEVSDALSQRFGIATRPGLHCAPRLHRRLGTAAQGAVRFSFGWCSTEAEADAAIHAVEELAR